MFLDLDGRQVFVHTGGVPLDAEASQPTLLFLHGAGMDHSVWVFLSRYFAHRGWRVLAPDLPGHGRSPGPAIEDINGLAQFALGLLTHLPAERRVLVGHSMGALTALAAAAKKADAVTDLVLMGAAAEMPVHPNLLDLARKNDPLAGQLISDWGHGPAAHLGGHPASGLWLLGSAESLLAAAPPGVLANDLAACAAYQDGMSSAAAVLSRSLVLAGAADRMSPAKAGKALAAAIPSARFETLSESGHMMMLEAPRETLKALKTFLEAA